MLAFDNVEKEKANALKDETNLSRHFYDHGFFIGDNSIPDIKDFLKLRTCITKVIYPENQSTKNTLSSRYGLNKFPFHTDGVTNDLPPHFILIQFLGVGSSSVEFSLHDMQPLIEDRDCEDTRSSAIFTISNGRKQYLIEGFSKMNNKTVMRYNPAIMKPANKSALCLEIKIKEIVEKDSSSRICFYPKENSFVIFDNYRFLHARGEVPLENLENRLIKRTWIY